MSTETKEKQSVDTFEILKEIRIAAPIEIAFEAMLDQLGEQGQMPGDKPFPMKLEQFPGGRWYRDTGNNAGHLWGHVSVIKPPNLLEITGPLMIPNASINHLQYKFKADGGVTLLTFAHRSIGLFTPEFRDGLHEGWGYWLERITKLAEQKAGKGTR